MRLSNGFVIDKEKTFGELKFTAVRDVFLQNEDGTCLLYTSQQLCTGDDRRNQRFDDDRADLVQYCGYKR